MIPEDLSTLDAELVELAPTATFLEARIVDEQGARHLPFLSDTLEFQFCGSRAALNLRPSGMVMFHLGTEEREIHLDEVVQREGGRLSVVDLRTLPPYWLMGLSPELHGKRWPVQYGCTKLGRKGSRQNDIVLAHRSISRSHASIHTSSSGSFLEAESSALSAINSKPLKPQQRVDLSSQDLLQLGEWHFRWEKEEKALHYAPGILELQALGMERATVDEREIVWHNEKAKDLLYRLAYSRSTLTIERLVEEYWPERPNLRQRKNLSHVLKSLQSELGLTNRSMGHMVERTAETLRLNPERVANCDFWRLKEACRQGDLQTLLDLFQGSFLLSNERPWARAARRELFLLWLSSVQKHEPNDIEQGAVIEIVSRVARETPFEGFVVTRIYEFLLELGFPELAESLRNEARESG
jgi:DNA-binding SARP family transcriptional activator